MKKIILLLSILLSTQLVFSASSLETAVITYRHLDSLKYEVTVKAYRNCAGIKLSGSQPIYALCKNSSTKIALNINLKSIRDVTPICSTQSKPCNPSNTNASGKGMEEHVFIDTVDFNSSKYSSLKSCGEIVFEYAYCCRPTSITNLDNSYFYTYAYLNRNYGEGNSSPQISMPPVHKLCCNQPFFYNVGALDTINHDSISYSFDDVLESFTSAVKFNSVFSKDYPISVYYPGSLKFPYKNTNANPPIGLTLDPENGDLIFTPVKCYEQTVLVIRLTEWRKDSSGNMKVIGITRQELLFSVQDCPDNNPPIIDGPYFYKVCAGDKICFNITSDDNVYSPPAPLPKPAPDTVSVFWNSGIKGGSFTIVDPKALRQTGRFCWTPKVSDARTLPYQFVVEVRDNYCPINAVSRRAFRIEVKPRANFEITKNILSCNQLEMKYVPENNSSSNSYFTIVKDSTGNIISDARIFQFNSTQNVFSIVPSDTIQFYKKGTYYLEYTLNEKPYDCPITILDTIIIGNSLDNLVEVEDTFFCASTSLTLSANALVSSSYTQPFWHTGNAADTNISVVLMLSAPITQLRFSAIDKKGCTVPDFITIKRIDIPSFYLGNDTFICSKNRILLRGPNQNNDPQLPFTYKWQNASNSDSFNVSQIGKYWLTVSNVCGSMSDTIVISNTVDLLQPISPIHFCNVKSLTIQPQLKGYKYNWHEGLGNNFTANVSATGQYICNIILTCGDTLVETIAVIAEQKPVLSLLDSLVYCQGTSAYIVSGIWDEHTRVLWNDNSKDSIKLINTPGLYILSATNVCGVFIDSLLAIERALPKADLGRDTAYCSAFSHFFDFSSSTDNILWNDSSKSKIRTITQSGIYWIKASNMCGTSSDTVAIIRSFLPQVDLGNDTALKIPFLIMLNAKNTGASFDWSNKSTLGAIFVSNFGTYWVKVSTPCGVAIDSITITDAAANKDFGKNDLKIYPNPTTGQLNISSLSFPIQKIQITSVIGEEVMVQNVNDQGILVSIDLNPLVEGVYYIKIQFVDGSVGVYKVIKSQ
jgi:hypothetical protein